MDTTSCGAFLLLLLVRLASSQSFPTPSQEYQHRRQLDGNGQFYLFWSFDDDTIRFETHVRTLGWFGLGFTHNGRMTGADIVTGWVKDGRSYLQDRHAEGNELPAEDASHDYALHDAWEKDDFTVFSFSRRLDTCDKHDFLIREDTVRLIFAWNPDDPLPGNDVMYHGASRRGARSVLLLDRGSATEDIEEDLQTYDLQVRANLPAQKTYYHCKYFRSPPVTEKHHIVKIEPIIDHVANVHHMLVMLCHGEVLDYDIQFDCYRNQLPGTSPNTTCDAVIYAWAVGQSSLVFPKEAGLSIGGENDATSYMIEIHYDNPGIVSDIEDTTRVRLHHTPELREHDVGMLILGHTIVRPPLVLPPGVERVQLDTFCGGHCTRDMIPESGIHLISSFLHTHTFGVGLVTKHIRGGVEQPEIARDDYYDFDYQTLRMYPVPRHILPGDEMITTCYYNTNNATLPVLGGLDTEDEMCLNLMMYYPKIQLQSCISEIQQPETLYNILQAKLEDSSLNMTNMYKELRNSNIRWDEADGSTLQEEMTHSATYTQFCVKDGMPAFGRDTRGVVRPRVTIHKPYIQPSTCGDRPPPPGVSTASGVAAAGTHVIVLLVLRYM